MTFFLATLLKPFFMLVLSACVLVPVRMAVMRHVKPGRFKDVLLFRVSGNKWTPKLVLLWSVFLVAYLGSLIYIATR